MAGAVFTAESPWIRRAARPAPSVRLICLPYAGGGASVYRDWPELLPPSVEVLAVQLPGREDRSAEDPPAGLNPLVRAAAIALRPFCTDEFVLYGHCAGGLLAYELARELGQRHGIRPRRVIAAAQPAPQSPPPARPLHTLPDAELLDTVRERGGLPDAVLANPAMVEFLLPLLRADFALWEQYRHRPGDPLPCPVTTLRGTEDTVVDRADLAGWESCTTAGHSHHEVDGGHYFVNRPTERTLQVLARTVLTD
ncbi:thioesterase II family protein [Kitasatospora sp. NPDC059673]|uniref:thioesterase II family protein n=1 Tax=Kitasatospora sp. NPDC059673 TaxID=3346901 RepID=UPI0036894AF3